MWFSKKFSMFMGKGKCLKVIVLVAGGIAHFCPTILSKTYENRKQFKRL